MVKVVGDLYGLGECGRVGHLRDRLRDCRWSCREAGAGVGWRRRCLGNGGRVEGCGGGGGGGGRLFRRFVRGDLLRVLRLALGSGDGLRSLGRRDLERRGLEWLRRGIVVMAQERSALEDDVQDVSGQGCWASMRHMQRTLLQCNCRRNKSIQYNVE